MTDFAWFFFLLLFPPYYGGMPLLLKTALASLVLQAIVIMLRWTVQAIGMAIVFATAVLASRCSHAAVSLGLMTDWAREREVKIYSGREGGGLISAKTLIGFHPSIPLGGHTLWVAVF